MFYSDYPQFDMHPKLWDVGLLAIPPFDHIEHTPLAHADWIKFVALFFHKEREANQMFHRIAERCQRAADLTRHVNTGPQVLAGSPSARYIWSTHGGRSYMASPIHDVEG